MKTLHACITDLADALGIADGCPSPECTNVEPPRDAVPIPDGFMAAYQCSDCGVAWTTDYLTRRTD